MTTAGRVTFESAKGGKGKNENALGILSQQFSSRDMPAHLKLKTRQLGQESMAEIIGKDFRSDLLNKEKTNEKFKAPSLKPALKEETDYASTLKDPDDASKALHLSEALINLDKDDENSDENSDFEKEEGSDEDKDEDDDETAQLLLELQRIKKERAEEAMKKEIEKREEEERIRMENTKMGNPLMNIENQASYMVKRRWDDDVVFKNCNVDNETKQKKTFINDTIRSDFHRKFMDKYIK